MAVLITDKSERSEILRQLIDNQARYEIVFHKNDRKGRASGWTVWGNDIASEFQGLWINFWDEEDFVAMIVCGGNAELHMSFVNNTAPSAGFARVDGKIWLLRTRRVHAKQRPLRPENEKIVVEGRTYFKVSQIDDPQFIEKVFLFHMSRETSSEITDYEAFVVDEYRGGRGSSPHQRNASGVDPRHPIVYDKLYKELGLNNGLCAWKRLNHSGTPTDLYLTNGLYSFIFEIKPYTNITTVGQSIGQLLLYRHLLGDQKARLIAVLPTEGCNELLKEAFSAQGIEILAFNWDQGTPQFSPADIDALSVKNLQERSLEEYPNTSSKGSGR